MPRGKTNERPEYGFDPAGQPVSGDDLISLVKRLGGNKILLSFSMGKDSLATWLYLQDKFEVIPYFLYWIPGLSFVEAALDYYEEYFGRHIIRLPHPLFYNMFATGAYQEPHNIGLVQAMQLPSYDYADIDDVLAEEYKLDKPFCAVGMRVADNVQRRNLIMQMGALGFKRRRYYQAIWDWDINDVVEIIKRHQVKIPIDYKYWGRTLAAFDYQYLKPLRNAFPQDYEVVKQWFPLIDLEFYRHEQIKHQAKQG